MDVNTYLNCAIYPGFSSKHLFDNPARLLRPLQRVVDVVELLGASNPWTRGGSSRRPFCGKTLKRTFVIRRHLDGHLGHLALLFKVVVDLWRDDWTLTKALYIHHFGVHKSHTWRLQLMVKKFGLENWYFRCTFKDSSQYVLSIGLETWKKKD